MDQVIVFASHTIKGARDAWYIDERKGAVYIKNWDEILSRIDDGTPKKVVVYPNAEAHILDNSKDFYKKMD